MEFDVTTNMGKLDRAARVLIAGGLVYAALGPGLLGAGVLFWLALISSVLAFWSYLTLLGRIGAGRAGYATVLFPVFALMLSAVVEDYRFTLLGIAGIALVGLGNILVLKR